MAFLVVLIGFAKVVFQLIQFRSKKTLSPDGFHWLSLAGLAYLILFGGFFYFGLFSTTDFLGRLTVVSWSLMLSSILGPFFILFAYYGAWRNRRWRKTTLIASIPLTGLSLLLVLHDWIPFLPWR